MLTLKKLKEMEPYTTFARGVFENKEDGIFIQRGGGMFRWVACRGQYHDWCIYCGPESFSEEYITINGDKIFTREYIKSLVPCDKEALEMYRD